MIDFLKYRLYVALFSMAMFVSMVGVYFYKEKTRGYGLSYSVDFTGGTQMLLGFDQAVESDEIRSILEEENMGSFTLRAFSPKELLVRIRDFSRDAQGVANRVKERIFKAKPDYGVTILQSESVGPGMGSELRWKSAKAFLIAFLVLLLYLAFVFWSKAFAIGAGVALLHDALVMFSLCIFFDRDISTTVISAILAVLGYSVNDTIVIFSQIRNNAKKMKGHALYEIVNKSLNQTLRRTLLTSISTVLSVGAMFVLGGEALRDFSLTLLIGIIFGTYSSIYIASPIMMLLYKEDAQAQK